MKLDIKKHNWVFIGEKEDEFQQWIENWSLKEVIDSSSKYNKLITFPR